MTTYRVAISSDFTVEEAREIAKRNGLEIVEVESEELGLYWARLPEEVEADLLSDGYWESKDLKVFIQSPIIRRF